MKMMTGWRRSIPPAALLLMCLVPPARGDIPQPAPPPLAALEVAGPSGVRRLTPADLAGLPRQSVTVVWHGRTSTWQGPLLSDVLSQVGAPRGEALRGPALADVVVLTAQDGYRVVLSLAETDAGVRPNRIILALQTDGHALAPGDGTVRLVVEGDLKPARSERQVARIEVRRLD